MLAINAVLGNSEHSVAWISESSNNSVSVGLADRALISPRFHARQFLWNAYNRVTLKYLVPENKTELRLVHNPHLTFHPPIYFHLRANKDEELFAGIADVKIMLDQDGFVPWIRFVSRSLLDIPPAGAPRNASQTVTLRAQVQSEDASLGVGVDIVRAGSSAAVGHLVNYMFDCGEYRFRVFCDQLRPQQPTLSWYHQY